MMFKILLRPAAKEPTSQTEFGNPFMTLSKRGVHGGVVTFVLFLAGQYTLDQSRSGFSIQL